MAFNFTYLWHKAKSHALHVKLIYRTIIIFKFAEQYGKNGALVLAVYLLWLDTMIKKKPDR